jgi:AcrR family transcriptional regulator
METERRAYRLGARAAAVDETRNKIVEAAIEAFLAGWYDEVTLRQVAKDAGVALATVVNHFGTKEQLFAAGVDTLQPRIEALRDTATPNDLNAAVEIVVDHYEATGDAIIRALRDGGSRPRSDARPLSRASLSPRLGPAGLRRPARRRPLRGPPRRAVAAYVAALDVYVWKRLRVTSGSAEPTPSP